MSKKLNSEDKKKGCTYLVVIAAIIFMFFYFTCDSESDSPLTKQEIRKNHIIKLLYDNGSNTVNVKLMQLIKKDLNDPNSYKLIELTHADNDSIILVKNRFTAKNGFGGTLTNEVIVSIDTLGNIIDVLKWID